jgi:DNA-binding response OmpR family regulator
MAKLLIGTADTDLYDRLSAEAEGFGHTCLWCTDGGEVVDTAIAGHVDAVFVDVNLSVFPGLEASQHLRAQPEVPHEMAIFLLSDDDVDVHVLERHGITARFPKTHEAWQVSEVITRTLRDEVVWMDEVDQS